MLPLLLAAVLIELTPGPNMTWLLVSTLDLGWRFGLAATCGIALGLLGVGLALTVGLAALLEQQPWLYTALHWTGASYLL